MKTKEVDEFPKCDFCDREAHYDVPIRTGQWAYLCEKHYDKYAKSDAEVYGTKFKKRVLKVVIKPEKMKTVTVPMTLDSIAEVHCPYCGTARNVEPDANYVATCEGCGHKYRIASII